MLFRDIYIETTYMKLILTQQQTFNLFESGILNEHNIKMSPESIELLKLYMWHVNRIKQ